MTSKENILHSILETLESWKGNEADIFIETDSIGEFIEDIKKDIDLEFEVKSEDKVCVASLDYKYEYNKILQENIKLKQYSVMYKEVIENLAMLLNKEI